MPIPKLLRAKLYGAEWKRDIRPPILERAGNRCEYCARPGKTVTDRMPGGYWRLLHHEQWHNRYGELVDPPRPWVIERKPCVLTIAHLNQDPTDNRPENLACLCAGCHLRYDQKQHYANARRSKAAKIGQEWLSPELAQTTYGAFLEGTV